MLACVEKVKRKTLITGNSDKLQSTLHTTISGIRVAHILFLKNLLPPLFQAQNYSRKTNNTIQQFLFTFHQ